LLFLPGRGDTTRSFEKEGFLQAVRRALPDADLIGVEAHLGYYLDHTIVTRLREDVIIPAKDQGYQDIWLIGVSMGGVGALLYDSTYPGEVTGVLVLAPYLGRESLVQKIRTAGGVERWQSSRDVHEDNSDSEAQFTALIWSRLKFYEDQKRTIGRVYLGFGNQDRFNATDSIFGDMLPAEQVFTAKGGHDWFTWNLLGERMINAVSASNGWSRNAAKIVPASD
jgi:pimeloyl-ACP methyl ester carboxylesterase